jgi:hypothetical protein
LRTVRLIAVYAIRPAHALVKLDMAVDASPELVRETLAAVCDRAISMARKHRCGTILLEKGLGKLRSSGKSRSFNRLLNYWARSSCRC